MSHREFRIVERALYRQIEVDDALAVLEQGNRKKDGQLGRGRAVDMLAERELIEDELVRRGELAVVDLVVRIRTTACPSESRSRRTWRSTG